MNDLTDEQRARALEMYNTWAKPHGIGRADSMPTEVARGWLAVEAHVLASHACPVPVWQPIEPGTVVKAGTRVREDWDDQITEWTLGEELIMDPRRRYWLDPRTIPAAPEPWPGELVDAITGTIWPIDRAEDARAVLDLLAARGLLDRAAITGGEQA